MNNKPKKLGSTPRCKPQEPTTLSLSTTTINAIKAVIKQIKRKPKCIVAKKIVKKKPKIVKKSKGDCKEKKKHELIKTVVNGRELSLGQIAVFYNIKPHTVYARYRVGNRGKLLIRPTPKTLALKTKEAIAELEGKKST